MSSEDQAVPINTALPMSLHPANLSGESPNLVHAMTTAYGVLSQFHDAETELTNQAKGAMPKPPKKGMSELERTLFQRDLDAWQKEQSVFRSDLAEKALPKIEAANKSLAKALASAQAQVETLEAQIQHKLAPHAPTGTIHTEVRERLGKKPTLPTLQKFVESGDPIIVGTIIGSHPLLLGIDQKTHDILKGLAMDRYTPEEKAKLQAVRADLAKAEAAKVLFVKESEKRRSQLESKELDIIERAFA